MTTSTTSGRESTRSLVDSIVRGLQAKKGHSITILDLQHLHDRPTDYMVIAESNTPTGISALEDSVWETAQKETGDKPVRVHKGSGEWVAMDYIDVMVHLFTPDLRAYYRLEQLWEDAEVTRLEDEL